MPKRNKSSKILALLIFPVAILLSFVLPARMSAQTLVTRGPYLQSPTPNSIVIRWRTSAGSDSEVKYGPSPSNLNMTLSDPVAKNDHEIKITGLNPYTRYYYSVGSIGQVLSGADNNHYFVTHPLPGTAQPIRVWAIGDFGKGNSKQAKVRDAYLNYNGSRNTDVWIWLGDNAYDTGTDVEYTDKVFDPVNGYGNIFPRIPFYPTPGNHDYLSVAPPMTNIPPATHSGPYYDIVTLPTQGEAGGVPSGMEAFYSFDYGNAHFISLNSELGSLLGSTNDWIGTYPLFNIFASSFTTSPFTDWLHADLQANTKPWVIAYFHQPAYTDGSHEAGTFWEIYMQAMRENILPILEQYQVDLVVCGHSHVYERSFLVQGHYDDPGTFNPATMIVQHRSGTDSIGEAYIKDLNQPAGNRGTVYVVCGNSGSSDDNPGLQYPANYAGYGCDTCVGSFIIDIHGDTLNGKYLAGHGAILDDFTIYKTGATGVQETDPLLTEFNVFPNPFEQQINVSFTLAQSADLRVDLADLEGRSIATLHQGPANKGKVALSLNTRKNNLSAGNYLLRVQANDKVLSQRLIKMK